ncbi:carboxypeptidase C (cathepsin A) [Phyllobacterium sp. 1468]|uniref:S10 family serine carboxypeptidase-like protein n=1 Tax=Phyllobacterium sp. 1468 TaxID=2817759 RepID=UPI00285BF844|nr:hypothetical protein [Phyllobacterium sp. 1468]MDR6632223.1 carboxypeptidase C (cathepsin A) [Phyllobacterium sp. 1468]
MHFRLCWLFLALFLASCSGSSDSGDEDAGTFPLPGPNRTTTISGGNGGPPWGDSQSTEFKYGPDDAIAISANYETRTSRAQTINLKGNVIAFTATAGHLKASADGWGRFSTGQAPGGGTILPSRHPYGAAAIFYTAYTRDDLPKSKRPVTFVFNGGPGGASADLDLDFLGPKGLKLPLPASGPLQLIDNPDTLLDKTDLVFVDPVGTGYSAAVFPATNSWFWGVERDAQILSDFVTRYINVNNRQLSPKYIYGVSYGGIRVPIMGELLLESKADKYAVDKESPNILNGLILNSPLLDLTTDCLSYYSAPCGGVLPTYAMVASYHKKSTERNGRAADAYVDDVRDFAVKFNQRAGAEFKGMLRKEPDRTGWDAYLQTQDGTDFVNQLYKYTGIGQLFKPGDGAAGNPWVENPNMDPVRFTQLFDPKFKLQLTDGRVAIPVEKVDPSLDRTSYAYDYIKAYQKQFIGYDQVSPYLGVNGEIIDRWDYTADHGLPAPYNGDRTQTSVNDLAYSLTLNPALKVLIEHGYYDLNTPFHQNEINIANAHLSARIPVKLYEGGHGVAPSSTDDEDRVLMDLKDFYDRPPGVASTVASNVNLRMGDLHGQNQVADDRRAAGIKGGMQ